MKPASDEMSSEGLLMSKVRWVPEVGRDCRRLSNGLQVKEMQHQGNQAEQPQRDGQH